MNTSIDQCVEDTVQAFVEQRMSVRELRDVHNQIGNINKEIAEGRHLSEDEINIARFMHQVTKGALARLNTHRKRTNLAVRRSAVARAHPEKEYYLP